MEKILILDTETTNSLDDALVYDCGFIVADLEGNIYDEYSFINADVFCNKELMASAYFADKIPTYWEQIKSDEVVLTSFNNIKWAIRYVMKKHKITKVFAYNCRFDYCSMATTQRYLTKSKYRFVFPYGTEFHDILILSRRVLRKDENYRKFCKENNYLTSYKGNKYTAEIVARYLFDNSFVEEHTALADCEIEYKILLECMARDTKNTETKLW